MGEKTDEFAAQLVSRWLPAFCEARGEVISPERLVRKNLDALSDVDAGWFLRAVREGHVVEEGEFFSSDLAGAKEKILWSDAGVGGARRAHLWLEPVITIGALARLAEEYRWPRDRVGLQSKAPWPFDLMGYGADRETEVLACEVKKAPREIDVLVRDMTRFAAIPPLPQDPDSSTPRNAYRKVVGIRRTSPDFSGRWDRPDTGSCSRSRVPKESRCSP